MKHIKYKINSSNSNDILTHLLRTDDTFLKNLKKTTNLEEYSKKLATKSIRFEAWNHSKVMVGIVCAYFKESRAYVSNVSVDSNYSGLGIGKLLLKKAIDYSKIQSVKIVELEVANDNSIAISFYIKHGFRVKKILEYTSLMTLKII